MLPGGCHGDQNLTEYQYVHQGHAQPSWCCGHKELPISIQM